MVFFFLTVTILCAVLQQPSYFVIETDFQLCCFVYLFFTFFFLEVCVTLNENQYSAYVKPNCYAYTFNDGNDDDDDDDEDDYDYATTVVAAADYEGDRNNDKDRGEKRAIKRTLRIIIMKVLKI